MTVASREERRLSAALRLLVEAGSVLAGTFDYAAALETVAGLVVPCFAAGFAVKLDEGEIATTVVRRGVLAGGVRSVPLVARGSRLGWLMVRVEDEAPLPQFDLWGELAGRIAVAVDASHVYAREHHVADTLQRALLPERLPDDPVLRFDAAYLPGADEAAVGGDWYDAFRLPDGRIAFSVGDVAGHGLRAAIVMAEVRQAFRAAALNPNLPSLVLERANTIVNMRSEPVMVTALFGTVDPVSGTLSFASAGHPAPLLALPDGSVHLLPKDGLPLGVVDQVDAADRTITLPPGADFVLYTDGLIEYERDPLRGEERLLAAAAEIPADEPLPAHALLGGIFAHRRNSDDAAVLTIAHRGPVPDVFSGTFSALPIAAPIVRRSLALWAARAGLDEDARFALLTAVGEAVANAVEHAYGSENPGLMRVRAERAQGQLVVTIEDEGRWKPARVREERGRGLPMMRALMDAVEIRTHQARTEVRLSRALAS